jgi:hypothetical protein
MKEALNLSIEVLEELNNTNTYWWQEVNEQTLEKIEKAIAAIKEALAQPEQEPVAFVKGCNRGQWEIFPAKAHQIFGIEQPLYTTSPQRTAAKGEDSKAWVVLEAEDRLCAKYMQDAPEGIEAVIDYIEAKLKEKNT